MRQLCADQRYSFFSVDFKCLVFNLDLAYINDYAYCLGLVMLTIDLLSLNMAINSKKSCCLRNGQRHNVSYCSRSIHRQAN